MRETLAVLDRVRPDVVVGYGGYVSVPAYLGARRRKLPLVVHEQNALPGLANKVGARLAGRVAVSFPDTPLRNAEYVGLPIRRMISNLTGLRPAPRPARSSARPRVADPAGDRRLPGRLDGSTEAVRLRQGALADVGVQVLHVVGPNGEAAPERNGVPYVVLNFVDRMDLAYAAADLVVRRAGASSVTEAAAVGLLAVFVLLPIGNGEQDHNARPVVDAGGGVRRGRCLDLRVVAATVPALATDAQRLARWVCAAAGAILRDADEKLARIVLESAR